MAAKLYHIEARHNHIAKRRLNIAKRQIKKSISSGPGNCINRLNLGFIDWYPGFEKDIKFAIDLFLRAGLKAVETSAEDADILVAGSYGNRLVIEQNLSQDKLVIFLTGENLCPSYHIHDFSISTRKRSFCGKNVRLPQWLSDISFETDKMKLKPWKKECQNYSSGPRDLLVSAIYNNSTPEREELLYYLRRELGEQNVHVYGSHRTGEVDKFEILSRTVINVCLENSLGEGYVTEKLLHARAMGCKALYWGDSSFSDDFRTDGVLNIRDIGNPKGMIEWCRLQLQTPVDGRKVLNEINPIIFARDPLSNYVECKLAEWASIILAWRKL